jgi:hypothetical protein
VLTQYLRFVGWLLVASGLFCIVLALTLGLIH